jgi:hypothetical protein
MASLILVGKNICMHLYPLIQKNFQLKHIDPHIQIYNKDIKDVLGLGSEILRSLGFSFIFSSLFAHDSPWIIFCGNLLADIGNPRAHTRLIVVVLDVVVVHHSKGFPDPTAACSCKGPGHFMGTLLFIAITLDNVTKENGAMEERRGELFYNTVSVESSYVLSLRANLSSTTQQYPSPPKMTTHAIQLYK